jgi:hypothetical protein
MNLNMFTSYKIQHLFCFYHFILHLHVFISVDASYGTLKFHKSNLNNAMFEQDTRKK